AVEDLHWADTATLRALRTFVRMLANRPFVLLATVRDGPWLPELDRWLGRMSPHVSTLARLGPLDPDACSQLATAVLGRRPGRRLTDLVTSAGGNPLWIVELLRALRAEDALEAGEGIVE